MTYYHGDQLNSVTTRTDQSGVVTSRAVITPYGRQHYGGGDPNIALAGQRLDGTGLYHMGAREMNPAVGLFVTPDPSDAPDPERPQTLNRFAYANNTPTNLIDPTGYEAAEPEVSQSSPQGGGTSLTKAPISLLLVGDSVIHKEDTGRGFELGAQTLADDLSTNGLSSKIANVRSFEELQRQFTQNGSIGAVYFFGHGGPTGVSLGREKGNNWDIGNYNRVDYSRLTSQAPFVFFACNVGAIDKAPASFAEYLSYHTRRPVYASRVGTNMRSTSDLKPYYAKRGDLGPNTKPVYWRSENGEPMTKFDPWGSPR